MKPETTIYFADDERMMVRQAIKNGITEAEIIEAVDGQDLVEKVTAQKGKQPIIILTDMNMPRMNGLEAVKLIKSNSLYENIPILMVSTSYDPQFIRDVYARGINSYVTKPSLLEGFLKIAEVVKMLFKSWKK